MLHVIDNAVPEDLLKPLRQLCLVHGQLKQNHPGEALFSWRANDGQSRSIHAVKERQLMERFLNEILLPVSDPFCHQRAGVEWWCNTNNDLDWHIDKDEVEGRQSGTYQLPLLSTVFYPHVSCAGGELLLADNASSDGLPRRATDLQFGDLDTPVRNRLVLFSPGLLHRINPFEGERYSLAVNIWGHEPLHSHRRQHHRSELLTADPPGPGGNPLNASRQAVVSPCSASRP